MKGKKEFTKAEFEEIKKLTEEKNRADKTRQVAIRNKIRNIGFYYSDFSSKKGYTVADIEKLVRDGEIIITQ